MRFSDVLAASLVAPLVAAHGGMPQLHGMPHHLRARNPFAPRRAVGPAPIRRATVSSVNTQPGGTCGPANGNTACMSTECCSPEGNCGNGPDYCPAPDCLFEYGPACDANQTPAGASTRNDARPQLGSVPYGGAGIYTCVQPGEVALTFDDGPYIYTNDILDVLASYNAPATFFITGNNLGKGEIDTTWNSVITRMAGAGHQIASHTWSHQDLNNITESEVYDQMIKNEMALRNILGYYPTYMRPPYSDCGATCENVMQALGYHIIYFDVDTDDYDNDSPLLIQNAKNNFKNGIDSRGASNERLVIAHDIHEQTAHNLTGYMLGYLQSQGLTPVTVGRCLGDDQANWYRTSTPATPSSSSSSTSSAPTSTPTVSSLDGTCGNVNGGNNKGYTCTGFKQANGLLSECCSPYGYCGNSASYCGDGCQAGFGKCGIASTTSSAPMTTPTATSPNGACAGSSGFSCNGYVNNAGVLSECCSSWGYCGNSTDFCGTGCQQGYGKCLGGSSSMSSMSSTTSAASSMSSSMSSMSSSKSASGSSSMSSSMSSSKSSSSVRATSSSASTSSMSAKASGSSSTSASASGSSSSRASGSPTVTASSNSVKATSASSYSASSMKASGVSSYSASSAKPTSYSASSMKVSSYSASSMKASSYPASSAKPTSASYSAVQPSSVKAYSAASPSASAPVSKNGKCGTTYGSGQTCAGYKNSMGVAVECCCADSGTCSNDSWACGQGCDKNFGNCWGYY